MQRPSDMTVDLASLAFVDSTPESDSFLSSPLLPLVLPHLHSPLRSFRPTRSHPTSLPTYPSPAAAVFVIFPLAPFATSPFSAHPPGAITARLRGTPAQSWSSAAAGGGTTGASPATTFSAVSDNSPPPINTTGFSAGFYGRAAASRVSRRQRLPADPAEAAAAAAAAAAGVVMMPAQKVQRLFDTCKAAFAGGQVPTRQALMRVRSALECINPADVALDVATSSDSSALHRPIPHRASPSPAPPRAAGAYGPYGSTAAEPRCASSGEIGIFCIPASACIPLHNHPGMTVLSKLLYGRMHMRSFDWAFPSAPPAAAAATQPRLAELVEDQVIAAPCPVEMLFPTSGGNMHAFTALAPCALLDVLSPPYSVEAGRHCTYFRELPAEQFPALPPGEGLKEGREYGWLQECQHGNSFSVRRGHYRGPRVRLWVEYGEGRGWEIRDMTAGGVGMGAGVTSIGVNGPVAGVTSMGGVRGMGGMVGAKRRCMSNRIAVAEESEDAAGCVVESELESSERHHDYQQLLPVHDQQQQQQH
ncbi:unnamed protein product [Closterium sp. NIES-65]|nr:unnamed protein product [Closterium sp. NIES-65]